MKVYSHTIAVIISTCVTNDRHVHMSYTDIKSNVCLFVCPGRIVPREPVYRADPTGTCLPSRCHGNLLADPTGTCLPSRYHGNLADPTGTCLPIPREPVSRSHGNLFTEPIPRECVYRVVSSGTWLALLGLSVAVRCKRDELLRTGMHKDYLRFWKWSLFYDEESSVLRFRAN
jgi:hypothetical protein